MSTAGSVEELTSQVSNKESNSNADGGEIGRFVLDGGQHGDGEYELGGREHLNEEASCDRTSSAEPNIHCHRAR